MKVVSSGEVILELFFLNFWQGGEHPSFRLGWIWNFLLSCFLWLSTLMGCSQWYLHFRWDYGVHFPQMPQVLIAFGASNFPSQRLANTRGKMGFLHRRSWQRGREQGGNAGASLVGGRAKPNPRNNPKNYQQEQTRRCWPELWWCRHRQKQVRHEGSCDLRDLWLKNYFGAK